MQNIEKSVRQIYIPDGYEPHLFEKCKHFLKTGQLEQFTQEELATLRIFLQCDQSGAEALIVAYECYDGDYRQLFINGVKPHVYVAMKLFKDVWTKKMKEKGGLIEDFDIEAISNTPIQELKKNPFWRDLDLLIKDSDNWSLKERYYYLAKQTVHSSNYGIRAPHFRMNILEKSGGKIVISERDSELFLMIYHSLFPEITDRNKRIESQVEKTRVLYNMFGFPYQITNYNITEATMKEYYAWSAQSTVGEITRIAFTNLQEYIEESNKKWDLMADTHDSYMSQCLLYDVKDCMKKKQEYMNQRLVSPIDGTEFNMRSEVNIGFNWNSYKKDVNELGLQECKW